MDPSTTLKKLKEQAEMTAMRKLQSLFNTSDQLEQIEQHINRIDKRKNIVEAQLKSAIQSHFISVNSCMEQLQDVNKNLDGVRNTIYSIEDEYKTISHLETTLHELRTEAYRHKQLKSAKENMKNILDVDELAQKAHQHLEKNELLFAHKYLVELEKCRNDILVELGDPTENNLNDIHLVDSFFKEVKEIQRLLQNQIFLNIGRMIGVVRKEPKLLVTSLRIIEREEILDEDWRKKKLETSFMPSDRPKKWKEKCFAEIRKYIETRVQGARYKEREDDESWFSKQLGNICGLLVDDLKVVKQLCEPCFPPSYKIFEYFVDTVHSVLSAHLVELLETNQLQDKEFFVLLSWQDTYKSQYFMGNPSLKLDRSKIKDLLDEKHYNLVLEKHIEYTQGRMPTYLQNALNKCTDEWVNVDNHKPSTDLEGHYQSNLPGDINTILIQQLNLIDFAKDDRFAKATLKFLTEQINTLVIKLQDKLIEFRNNHFRNTGILKDLFVKRLVTISNDCLKMGENVINIREKFDKFIDKDEVGGPNDNYKRLANEFGNVASICIDFIIEDMYKCLEDHFKQLLSHEWMTNDQIINTILFTSNDYLDDLIHLKRDLANLALYRWHVRMKIEYLKGFLQNLSALSRFFQKYHCSNQSERTAYANKLSKEVSQMEQFFKKIDPQDDRFVFDFSVLSLMNRILKADDVDFLGVEIGALIRKCPEMTSDMLYALLSLRGDITKGDYKDKFEGYILDDKKIQGIYAANAKMKPEDALILFKREFKL